MILAFRKSLAYAILLLPIFAQAEIKVGIVLSETGPAAAIGTQTLNTVKLWPKTLGGEPAKYIVLNDASEVGRSVSHLQQLIHDDKVDVIVGPNTTAAALAYLNQVHPEHTTPIILLAAGGDIVNSVDEARSWVFKMPQNDALMATMVVNDMQKRGYKNVAFIGFDDPYGHSWWNEFSTLCQSKINVVTHEFFKRTDTSVSKQIEKILTFQPDAVLVAGAGLPALLPAKTLKEKGYKNTIYQTHGIGTSEFLKAGGKFIEGTRFPTSPGVVAKDLSDTNPVKDVAIAFSKKYYAQYGTTGTQFAGDAWGAYLLLDNAVSRINSGVDKIKPGTIAFRSALRTAIEQTKNLVLPNGIMNMNKMDHQGFDNSSGVMAKIKNGKFVYVGDD